MNWLTLKRRSSAPPPDPQGAEVRVYADDDGALRVIDHDGNDEAVGGDGGGGSQPAPEVAAVFASVPEPEQGATSAPTLAEIDTTYNIVAWRPNFDFTLAFAYNGDALFVTLPAGSANVFAAEISGASTGGVVAVTDVDTGTQTFTVADDQTRLFPADSEFWVTGSTGNDRRYTVASSAFDTDHTDVVVVQAIADATVDGSLVSSVGPDWDGEAPNLGDSFSDGGVTWYNIGTQAAWPPSPVTWEADTEYAAGTLVWPTVRNGHVYMVYPPGPYTAATEPDPWPDRGAYIAGDTGYLYDMGTKLATVYAGDYVAVTGEPSAPFNQAGLARLLIQMRDRLGYVPGLTIETSENGWHFLAVTNSTFIENHPDASSPPLDWQCTENAIVELTHQSRNPEPSSPFTFLTDNILIFRAVQGIQFQGEILTADAALQPGAVTIHGDDVAGLQIKYKTTDGNTIKTATIPWD